MSVAKPWMLGSLETCHSLWAFPGLEFSHATGLAIGGVQRSARDSSAHPNANAAAIHASSRDTPLARREPRKPALVTSLVTWWCPERIQLGIPLVCKPASVVARDEHDVARA